MREPFRRRGMVHGCIAILCVLVRIKTALQTPQEAQRFCSLTSLHFLNHRRLSISNKTLWSSEFHFTKSSTFIPHHHHQCLGSFSLRLLSLGLSTKYFHFHLFLFLVPPDWRKYKIQVSSVWVKKKILIQSLQSSWMLSIFFHLIFWNSFLWLTFSYLDALVPSVIGLLFYCVSLTGNIKQDTVLNWCHQCQRLKSRNQTSVKKIVTNNHADAGWWNCKF